MNQCLRRLAVLARRHCTTLAEAGFRAIAIDLRGYGESEVPEDVAEYTILHHVGNVVGVLDALGIDKAAIIGHDWGAPVAWHAALLRRDRFTAAVGLSVPFIQRAQVYPLRTLPETADEVFYQQHFQRRGIAEADMQRDVRAYLRGLLYASSGDGVSAQRTGRTSRRPGMVPRERPQSVRVSTETAIVAQRRRCGLLRCGVLSNRF
ncbi:alpha/beta fold hydrolase [Paraburkholderia sp. NMBU_R16]|uniref:alpha/beta fold hydrolase n=1 Tax=Paraburkholderia sp. NMBU_R16 TaxID=2698676 RepID=UPI00156617DD|nr:alpha/beta fold hydrolase [Paraburkholderia sp. NMBU_R16]NRO99308.1 alpha/beta fold hydrolase [Paraburkholderia sp. NMBU_R16]